MVLGVGEGSRLLDVLQDLTHNHQIATTDQKYRMTESWLRYKKDGTLSPEHVCLRDEFERSGVYVDTPS